MVPDMRDISADYNPIAIPIATGAAISEGTCHALHPATTAAHTALWLMNAPLQFVS